MEYLWNIYSVGDVPKPSFLLLVDLTEWLCMYNRDICAYGGLSRLLWYITEGSDGIDTQVFMEVNRNYQVYYSQLRDIVASGDCVTIKPNADRLNLLHIYLLENTVPVQEDCCHSDSTDDLMEVNSWCN